MGWRVGRPPLRIPEGRGRGGTAWDCKKPGPGDARACPGKRKEGRRPPGGRGLGVQRAGGMLARVECRGGPSLRLLHTLSGKTPLGGWGDAGSLPEAPIRIRIRAQARRRRAVWRKHGVASFLSLPSLRVSGVIHSCLVGCAPLGAGLGGRSQASSITAGPQRWRVLYPRKAGGSELETHPPPRVYKAVPEAWAAQVAVRQWDPGRALGTPPPAALDVFPAMLALEWLSPQGRAQGPPLPYPSVIHPLSVGLTEVMSASGSSRAPLCARRYPDGGSVFLRMPKAESCCKLNTLLGKLRA